MIKRAVTLPVATARASQPRQSIPGKPLLGAALAFAVVAGLAACGERPQDVTYKQGVYQGKLDTRAWDNPQFKNDQKAWELALKDRAQSQNEYKRAN